MVLVVPDQHRRENREGERGPQIWIGMPKPMPVARRQDQKSEQAHGRKNRRVFGEARQPEGEARRQPERGQRAAAALWPEQDFSDRPYRGAEKQKQRHVGQDQPIGPDLEVDRGVEAEQRPKRRLRSGHPARQPV